MKTKKVKIKNPNDPGYEMFAYTVDERGYTKMTEGLFLDMIEQINEYREIMLMIQEYRAKHGY